MSSQEFGGENEPLNRSDVEIGPYQRAARFTRERPAWQAYQETQRLISASDADISAFRFQLDRTWHVAAVALATPDRVLQRQIDRALRHGVRVSMPDEVFELLLARHRQVMATGFPWVEGHYESGARLL